MSDKPVFSTAATLDPTASIASTNKVLSNTYWHLTLTSGWPYLPTSGATWSEHRGRPALFRCSAADQRQPVARSSKTATPTTTR